MEQRKVSLFIASSVDGFIAGPDDNLEFLALVEKEGEDYGYADFMANVDTVVLGRKTYDKVMQMDMPFPYGTRECYVITHTPKPDAGSVRFHTGDPEELIKTLRAKPGKTIFVDGGASVIEQLMKQDLIDDYIVSFIPVVIGGGTKLFGDTGLARKLQLVQTKSFDTGLVQLRYTRPSNT